jgi:hypothetical protein
MFFSIPPALCRVEIQFQPKRYAKDEVELMAKEAEIEAPRGIKPLVFFRDISLFPLRLRLNYHAA